MSRICLPINQVRLTNVAIVRMNRHGNRFEVACYRNKILNYRQGTETDLSEVLQTDRVFTNVSKGLFAPTRDLLESFQTSDQEEVCKIILDRGDVQIGDMERSATLENTAREVANMVAVKCVHPLSNRPYTATQVRDAMKEAEFAVQPTTSRSIKQQFLDCVKAIQKKGVLDICRAKMELAIVIGDGAGAAVVNGIESRLETEVGAILLRDYDGTDGNGVETTNVKTNQIRFRIDPSQYRKTDAIAKDSGGKLEMIRHAVTQEGDADVSSELERNTRAAAAAALAARTTNCDDGGGGEEEEGSMMLQVEGATTVSNGEHNDPNHNHQNKDDDINDEVEGIINTRKKNKRAQKKNKKAKRRAEKERATNDDRGEEEGSQSSQDERVKLTTEEFDTRLTLNDKEQNDDETGDINTRAKQKKAQKKSKKAKRREKEEALARQERRDAEAMRRKEREAQLLGNNTGNTIPNHHENSTTVVTTDSTVQGVANVSKNNSGMKSCNTCGGEFTLAQYRVHFKSDWHRYNIKLKLKGATPVNEEEFKIIDSDVFFESSI